MPSRLDDLSLEPTGESTLQTLSPREATPQSAQRQRVSRKLVICPPATPARCLLYTSDAADDM
eukprot:1679668-Prymnesium_polylepis.1